MIRILLISLLLLTAPFVFAEETSQTEKSILVLDVSGSMWGVIDGKSKIEIARDVVSDLLKTWPANKELGLVAYGHREKGDCADIETVIPAGKLDAQSFDRKVRSLVPKGKTPMVASIRQAAEALKYSEDVATVILVSDGEETCEADPCAIAKELDAKGVNFTAHVIGFDLKNAGKVAEQQMKCIAESTGGKFLTADNASELSSALKQAVVAPVVEKVIVEEVKAPIKLENNLHAVAFITAGDAPMKEGLSWATYTLNDKGEKLDNIHYSYDPEYKTNLQPGKYLVEVKFETTVASQIVEITEDLKKVEFVLGTGTLKLKAFASEAELLKQDVAWDLKSLDGEVATYSYDAEPVFNVKPGKYNVTVKWGDAEHKQELEVQAGKTLEHSAIIGAGLLTTKAFATDGGEQLKDKLTWNVEKLVSALENKYELASYSYNAEPTFRLLAGNYKLKVKWGEAEVTKDVTVTAGQKTDVSLTTNGGVLKASIKAADGSLVTDGLNWTIFKKAKSLSGEQVMISYSYDGEPQFLLPAGDYDIQVKTASGLIKSEATVTAGERKELVLEISKAIAE